MTKPGRFKLDQQRFHRTDFAAAIVLWFITATAVGACLFLVEVAGGF